MQNKLHKIYYNYGEEGALNNNVSTLLKLVRKAGFPTASTSDVQEFLSKQPGYTVHRRIQKSQFRRRTIFVPTNRVRSDGDLIELRDLASWNKGHRYIFIVIDAFSRFVWAVAIKNKEANTTALAMKTIINQQNFHTLSLYTDAGKEFIGAPFQSVLKSAKIGHRICTSDDFHCPFVERVIRTIKEKLFQSMTTHYTRNWLSILPKVVATYNKSIHSATKMKPDESRKVENYLQVLKTLNQKRLRGSRRRRPPVYKYKKGDYVRILLGKGGALGRKGYLPRYTWEIFKILKRANDRPLDRGGVAAYILEDLNGELVEHSVFYEPELSRVHSEQLSREAPVREILQEKGDRVKVWFQGFPKSSAQWVPRKNLV